MEIYKNLSLEDMAGEIWLPVVGYEGLYEISNMGRVKTLNYKRSGKEKIMRQTFNGNGYLRVGLFKDGKRKKFRTHKLVAIAFIPNVENKTEIDHKNTIRYDNRVENLRWSTRIENMNNELTKEKMKLRKAYAGKNASNYKGFIALFPDGNITEEMTIKELEEMLGVYRSVITNIAKSNKPYKPRYKRLRHLEGIRVFYAEDYKKLVGDEIA